MRLREALVVQICGQTHPIVLHIKGQTSAQVQLNEPSNNQPMILKTFGCTGASKNRCTLSSLVKVNSGKGNHKKLCHLDPCSSATFCSEHLIEKLHITKMTNFLLHTMGREAVVPSYSLTSLETVSIFFLRCSHRRKCPSVRMM